MATFGPSHSMIQRVLPLIIWIDGCGGGVGGGGGGGSSSASGTSYDR